MTDDRSLINGFSDAHLCGLSVKSKLLDRKLKRAREQKLAPSNRKNKPYPPRTNRKFPAFLSMNCACVMASTI